mgnify:FL=1
MNTELVLIGVILLLCGLIGWKEREARLERSKLINALLAKNATEMVNLDLADKTQIKTEVPSKEPDFIPPENLSQEDWEKVVTNG